MNRQLHILHLEDDPDYSRLVRDLLSKEGVAADIVLVTQRAEFDAALTGEKFDLILADYSLPSWTGVQALEVARVKAPRTPFLLVSGTIGEQAAIDSLRGGATDYVLKQWPERLVPAVRRAVGEAEERDRRRHAETELMRREKYFRALTENLRDILAVVDRDGIFQYHSPSIQRALGHDPRSVIGTSFFALVHPEDLPAVKRSFAYLVENPNITVTEEFRVRQLDGSWEYREAVGQNLLSDPDIAGVVITSRDINERKQAEFALRSSELLFHSVWENSVDGMRLTDENGITVAVNEAFCNLVGLTRTELEGKPFTVIYAEAAPTEPIHQQYKQRFRDRAFEPQVERQFPLRNGQTLILEDTNSFVELRGHPPMLLSLFRDVTKQKRLEEQLRQSQKMDAIGQLAGGVAHDFNNILTVIHGHASLLLASKALSGPPANSAQQIVQAADRAAGLTRQLLTFSRRQMLQPRRLDMNEVATNITKLLDRILGEDIALLVQCASQPTIVHADAGMMEQVFLNLAVNARDAMPKGGQLNIRITTEDMDASQLTAHPEARPGRFVCLTATDTGCGIAPENLPRIFEPFFTTKETGKGTGLGLATVYGILKQHQGWVEVESAPGRGTTFRVYMPAAIEKVESVEEQSKPIPVRGGNETILVVEDEQPVRELVCTLLQGRGYKVLEAESGPKALPVWQEHKGTIDLVLTDMVMPERMNGWELAEILWAERPDLKVLFTSGYSHDVVGREFVTRCGANYLQKPYHPEKLVHAVRDRLDAREPNARR